MSLFPAGIAFGEAFCNRVEERTRLKKHIDNLRHTVLIAPRRYGKSSLIRQVMEDNQCIYVWIDFLSVTNQGDVEAKIKKACKELLFKLAPELKKLQMQTTELVKSVSPELNLNALGQTLTLHFDTDESIAIDEMLLQIDEYAFKKGKRAVIVCDEFQQISQIADCEPAEALIRHAVERAQAITYIFSGSNRHLLSEMFSNSHRPLYRLCQAMMLERIAASEYVKFLQAAALKQWQQSLSENVIQQVTSLTECHPFYVNGLCSELWQADTPPTAAEQVEQVWARYIEMNKSIIVAEYISLPLNQKRLITVLAQAPTDAPFGAEFGLRTKIPSSSTRRALDSLLEKDIVFVDADGYYRLLDPAVKYYVQ